MVSYIHIHIGAFDNCTMLAQINLYKIKLNAIIRGEALGYAQLMYNNCAQLQMYSR